MTRVPTNRLKRAGEIHTHELMYKAYVRTTSLIDRSRRARTLEDAIALQKDLAHEAWEAREFDEQIKKQKAQLAAELRVAKTAGDPETIRQLEPNIRRLDLARDANKRRRYAFRVVQDGIIWRVLRFDRDLINTLGEGAPVNYLSASFLHERAIAEQHWKEGRLAIFADLSNVLRTGDLLVVDQAGGPLVINEAKESGKGATERQLARIQAKIEYINTGRSDVLNSEAPTIGPESAPRIKTHLAILEQLFTKARNRGYAMSRAGEVLAVYAYDARGRGGGFQQAEGDRAHSEEKRFSRRLGWSSADVYQGLSFKRIDRDRKDALVTTAPYSIFPLDAETCAALSLGWVGYRTSLNMPLLRALSTQRHVQHCRSDGLDIGRL